MILFEAEEMNAKEFLLLSHSPNLRVVASTTSILIAVIFAGVKFSKRAVRFEFMLTCFLMVQIYSELSFCYIPGSLAASWNNLLKRAEIRHRKAYESRHTFAYWALSAGANPSFIANQMGYTNAQMVFTVYGKWMSEHDVDQIALLNTNFDFNTPSMPHKKVAGI